MNFKNVANAVEVSKLFFYITYFLKNIVIYIT